MARLAGMIALALVLLGQPGVAKAGKLSWLDDLVQEVILEAKAGGKGLVRGGDGARSGNPGRRPAVPDPRRR